MPNGLNQFAAKATVLTNNKFQLTRLRLTAVYAGLLLLILIISSTITYSMFSNRLERRFGPRFLLPHSPAIQVEVSFRNQARQELFSSLLLVNGLLFVGAVCASYYLAGLTLKPIQEMYEKQLRFLGDASHELRTPLAILQTDLENELSNTALNPEAKESTRSHLEEVRRMGEIVRDLLLISRLDNYHANTAVTEPVDLTSLVATARDRFKTYADQRHVQLAVSSSEAPEQVIVKANQEHLLQALSNILKNAIDYNRSGGHVDITLKRQPHQALILVTDTGLGIPAAEIPKLFDRFYRVDKSRARQSGGSGLGLSIAQAIARIYNGHITITSQLNQGTTVTFTLPLTAST